MIQLRHTGLYVNDLDVESNFYMTVFKMHAICEHSVQKDDLINELLQTNGYVEITKLITDQGAEDGYDDMIELIQAFPDGEGYHNGGHGNSWISECGVLHLAFGVDDLQYTVSAIQENGGAVITSIYEMPNGKACFFARDPEGNYLEIIGSIGIGDKESLQ